MYNHNPNPNTNLNPNLNPNPNHNPNPNANPDTNLYPNAQTPCPGATSLPLNSLIPCLIIRSNYPLYISIQKERPVLSLHKLSRTCMHVFPIEFRDEQYKVLQSRNRIFFQIIVLQVFTDLSEQDHGQASVFYCGNVALGTTLRRQCEKYKFEFRSEKF